MLLLRLLRSLVLDSTTEAAGDWAFDVGFDGPLDVWFVGTYELLWDAGAYDASLAV